MLLDVPGAAATAADVAVFETRCRCCPLQMGPMWPMDADAMLLLDVPGDQPYESMSVRCSAAAVVVRALCASLSERLGADDIMICRCVVSQIQ